jgi:MATE family multidrug resistance protein
MRRSSAYQSTWPFSRFEWPHGPKLRSLLQLGLPIGITYFAETSAFGLIAFLIARFGSTEIAAHQIALNFTSLVFMVPLSLGVAVLTRVGHSLGAGDALAARFRAWVGVWAGLGFAAVSALTMAVFNHQIAALYTTDVGVASVAAHLLFIAAIFQLSDSAQVVTSSAIRGYKITRSPMLVQLTAFWVVSLPLGYVWGIAPSGFFASPQHPMGAAGFWWALVVGLTVGALGLLVLLKYIARTRIAANPH